MNLKNRSLSNSDYEETPMQIQALDDKILAFVERKFRVSRSYATKTNAVQVRKFLDFVRNSYSLDVFHLVSQIKQQHLDPLDVLDKYYTFLSNYKRLNSKRYQSSTILQYVTTAKEFLNGEGCKIYSEDVKQRFKLPKITKVYEKGLNKSNSKPPNSSCKSKAIYYHPNCML